MSRLEYILIFFLLIILIAYLSFIGYIVYKTHARSIGYREDDIDLKKDAPYAIDINSPYQTDFFNKSAEHAERVLFGKIHIQEYGEPQYYGNELIDMTKKLNEETKKSIVIAIKYMCIEPISCRDNEKSYRVIAEQEKVPIWFIILRQAMKKVVPEFASAAVTTSDIFQGQNNIIPLYRQTG